MIRSRSILTLPVAAALLAAAPAHANLTEPSCEALAEWARDFDQTERWQPNDLGFDSPVPKLLAAPQTATLFGKAPLDFTDEEREAAVRMMRDCDRELRRERRREESRALNAARSAMVSRLPSHAKDVAEARAAIPEALARLASAEPSLDLLGFYTALGKVAEGREAYTLADRAARRVRQPMMSPAIGLVLQLRPLPQEEIVQIAATGAERAVTMRAAVRQDLLDRIAAVGPSLAGLESLSRLAAAAPRDYGGALGEEGVRELLAAITSRRAALGTEFADLMIARLGRSPIGPTAFAEIDAIADERALRVIASADAGRVREAAAARRAEVGEELLARVRRQLASIPVEEASLDVIDRQVLPEIARWPDSAAAQRDRFSQAAAERRRAILDGLNRTEAGPLEGRVYENPALSLEFIDEERVFVKDRAGQTMAGTYTEEDDGRVVVTLQGQSSVFAREGKRLVNGPIRLVRAR